MKALVTSTPRMKRFGSVVSRFSSSTRDTGSAAVARLLALPLTAVSTLLTLRIVVGEYGASGFGLVALISSLPLLVPFGDLGLGAAVTDVTARQLQGKPERVQAVLAVAARRLWAVAGVVVATATTIAALGLWGSILGSLKVPGIDGATAACFAIFALTLPLSLSVRLLLGSGRYYIAILATAAGPPLALSFTTVAALVGAPLLWFAVAPAIGQLTGLVIAALLASRTTGINVATAALSPGTAEARRRVAALGTPMLLLNLTLPIAYQADRLILSHAAGVASVATYSAAGQVYAPLLSLITSVGLTLWPRFAAARESGNGVIAASTFYRCVVGFGGTGLCMAIGLAALGGPLVNWTTSGAVTPSLLVCAAFASLLLVQGAHLPSGMLLTDRGGLLFQGRCSIAMLLVNLPISYLLAQHLGAAGPVLGSTISITVCMALPCYRRARAIVGPFVERSFDNGLVLQNAEARP